MLKATNKINQLIFVWCILHLNILNAQTPAYFINPFIGTANAANTYPGAVVPWGMVTVNPYTLLQAHQTNISYQKNAPYITGFSHVSLSGVGCADMGSIILMPAMGLPTNRQYLIKSAYTQETAKPGFYSVFLTNYGIGAAMSATSRTGLSKYTFTKKGNAFIVLDLGRSLSSVKGAQIKKINNTEVEGFKTDGNFCGAGNQQKVFFVIKIQKQNAKIILWGDSAATQKSNIYKGNNVGCWFNFKVNPGEEILVKVGISYVSTANARANLQAENNFWNFENIKQKAFNSWNKELSKIEVNSNLKNKKTIFYTGLYHTLLHPNIINDVNGQYPAMGTKKVMKVAKGHNRYTVFSLWDTYRNLHALLTLVYPERQSDMVQSMVNKYKESGWLPKWELASNETFVMAGDPAVAVIAETYLKGIRDFDVKMAYKAMLHNSNLKQSINLLRPGLQNYLTYKYIPNDANGTGKNYVWGSVATTLEYNYADWCLAQMAKAIGKKTDEKNFTDRAYYYKNLYDASTGFLRPKLKNGDWFTPFNPKTIDGEQNWPSSGGPGFIEGNAWQYTFMVPHDIGGLATLMGGYKNFVTRLQQSFDEEHFVLWNEPDMAYPYLFNYAKGEEWRTQKMVNLQLKKHFNATPAGIPGNDDCGTLSAWLVFSMLGFYPDNPVSGNYVISTPAFNSAIIKLNPKYYTGKNFVIKTDAKSKNQIFIKNITLNNKPFKSYFVNHKTLTKGGVLKIKTSNTAKK